jgi:hypothetical protein
VHCFSAVGTNLDGNGDFEVDYDYVVVSLRANVNTFNTPGVMEHCHFLKVKSLTSLSVAGAKLTWESVVDVGASSSSIPGNGARKFMLVAAVLM